MKIIMLGHIQCLKGKVAHYPISGRIKSEKTVLHLSIKIDQESQIHSFHQTIFFNLLCARQHSGHERKSNEQNRKILPSKGICSRSVKGQGGTYICDPMVGKRGNTENWKKYALGKMSSCQPVQTNCC